VGQDDLSAGEVRRLYPKLDVGLSTHSRGQLSAALAAGGLGYVALGPVFPTGSKKNPDPVVGTLMLKEAHELARSHNTPLVLIGGMTEERM
jgi:thiamine-phosphate pyrophosphorylase